MNNNETIIRAVAYCRFSSHNQREESIDAQLRAIHEYARQNNMVIIKAYCDSAISGTSSADRKQFQQMISDAGKREFTKVIVHKLDRFARNRNDSYGYKLELKKHGVDVVSVLEHIDDSPEGFLMEGVLDMLADFYSRNLGREVIKGMKENAYKSKFNGSRPPLGYCLVPRKDEYGNLVLSQRTGTELHDLAIDKEKAIIVKKIFDMVLERKTYPEIIAYLKENDYKTNSNKDFTYEDLLRILRNERYTGTYIFNRRKKIIGKNGRYTYDRTNAEETIKNENAFPAIVFREQFNAVQKLLDSRVRKTPGLRIVDYLLAGKIICGECGHPFSGERKRKNFADGTTYWIYYRCKSNHNKTDKLTTKANCHNSSIRKDEIEAFVLQQITDLIFSEKNFDKIFEFYQNYKAELLSNEHATAAIEKEISNIEKKIQNLYNAIADMGYTEQIKSQISGYEKKKLDLIEKLAEAKSFQLPTINKDKLKASYDKFKYEFQNNTLPNNKDLVDIFLNKVVVYKDHVEVYLNVLPALKCEDYGLEIDLNLLKSGEDGENPSSLLFLSPERVSAGSNSAITNLIRTDKFKPNLFLFAMPI
ncbi:MAG: recombinase family protein [Clostridia bacterium]|nr:recombinase family protein [Clostridia bacterium]